MAYAMLNAQLNLMWTSALNTVMPIKGRSHRRTPALRCLPTFWCFSIICGAHRQDTTACIHITACTACTACAACMGGQICCHAVT